MPTDPTYPIHPNPAALTADQRDGTACVICGGDTAAMRPVDVLDGVQLFACTSHEGTWPHGEPDLVRKAEEFDRTLIRLVQRIERDHGPMASNTMLRVLTAVTDDPPKLTENEGADLLRLVGRGDWESAAARLDGRPE